MYIRMYVKCMRMVVCKDVWNEEIVVCTDVECIVFTVI